MPDLYSDAEEAPWELLAKHLAGEASASEQRELHAWLTAAPARLPLLTDATRAWERGGLVPDAFAEADVEQAWQRFKVAADLAPVAKPTIRPEGQVVPLWPAAHPWRRVAAVLMLLVGAWAMLRLVLPSAPEMVTVAAGDQRRQAALPDGSQVWVNRHSTLRYATNFNEDSRVVELQGEAFFEVKKDHGRPFTVLANDTRTRVLGTSFNVRAYSAEDSVEVSVVTGRVAFSPVPHLSGTTDSVLLTPGLRGVIRRAAPVAAVQKPIVDPNFRAWQRDELVFDNQSLAQVVETMSRYYDTTVVLADPALARYRFTGTFVRTDLRQALRVVSLSANLSVINSTDGSILLIEPVPSTP
ncbi:FecR domain-containing protein [Hymenobacter tibetensis]|uniref:FecR domain-containing protein n=1 Tax=Hymenobacter tibetensis TaxID=497967 RepID=A0ABY4CZ01_9BACT|nr:FecR domain-containing protein [Hymenobacter tibetensis]UOG75498.1 FecR domain-containing protein [Hymenobacter tibetensis]